MKNARRERGVKGGGGHQKLDEDLQRNKTDAMARPIHIGTNCLGEIKIMFVPSDACAYLVPLQQILPGTIKKLLRVHPMRSAMLCQHATPGSQPSELHLCWLESVLVPIRPESGLMMIRTKLCFDKRRGASTRAT